jgi:hypothetical protein
MLKRLLQGASIPTLPWQLIGRLPSPKARTGFLLSLLVLASVYFGWTSCLVNNPQPLPQQPTVAKSNSLLDGSYYEVSVPPTGKDKYSSADYRIWIPNNGQTVRGLIVKQHGCGDPAAATGLDHANDLQWQALALKYQFALLGTKLLTGNQSCDNWGVIEGGSDAAFLKALRFFAQKSNHQEIATVPWVLWGHSGGADWSMQMMQKYSNRTIAVVAMRCGGVLISGTSKFASDPNPTIFGIPVLFALGEKEPTAGECLDLPKQIFSKYRKAGAVWTIAVAANTAHEAGDTRFLAIPYLDAILAQRFAATDIPLRSLSVAQGWLGNPITHAIAPIDKYKAEVLEAAWLPNKETARKWQEYVETGKISPTRKPVTPTEVKANRTGEQEAVITWKFMPDLENGLPSFHIYKNNLLIRTLKGQEHNFGDAPVPANPVLEFQDRDSSAKAIYKVSAFNSIGEAASEPVQILDSK